MLDSWLGIVKWKDALTTGLKPGLFPTPLCFFFFFFLIWGSLNIVIEIIFILFLFSVMVLFFQCGSFQWELVPIFNIKTASNSWSIWLYSCVMDYGLLHTMLPLAYGFAFVSLPIVLMEEMAFLPFPGECSKFLLRSFWKEQGRGKPKYILFLVWSQYITWVGPKSWGWGVVWLFIFVFRMRWEHLSFNFCFVSDTIGLGLKQDSTKPLA